MIFRTMFFSFEICPPRPVLWFGCRARTLPHFPQVLHIQGMPWMAPGRFRRVLVSACGGSILPPANVSQGKDAEARFSGACGNRAAKYLRLVLLSKARKGSSR